MALLQNRETRHTALLLCIVPSVGTCRRQAQAGQAIGDSDDGGISLI
jgi:hypothetical protein